MPGVLTKGSNYWTAALYFKAQNGTYKRVKQFANAGLHQRGGMTVYYIPPYDGVSNVTAFTPVRQLLFLIHALPITTSPWHLLCTILTRPGLPHARGQPPPPQHHRRIPRHLPPMHLQKRDPLRRRPLHRRRHHQPTHPRVRRRHPHPSHLPHVLGRRESRLPGPPEPRSVRDYPVRTVWRADGDVPIHAGAAAREMS